MGFEPTSLIPLKALRPAPMREAALSVSSQQTKVVAIKIPGCSSQEQQSRNPILMDS
jgi:hypothetical protein